MVFASGAVVSTFGVCFYNCLLLRFLFLLVARFASADVVVSADGVSCC